MSCGNCGCSPCSCTTCAPPVVQVFNNLPASAGGGSTSPATGAFYYHEPTTETFTMPLVGSSTALKVEDATRYAVGMIIYIAGIGHLRVASVDTGTNVLTVYNDGSVANEVPGTVVNAGATIMHMPPAYVPAAQVSENSVLPRVNENGAVVPAVDATVVLDLTNPAFLEGTVGTRYYIDGTGFFELTAIDVGAATGTFKNLGHVDNAAPGAVIPDDGVIIPVPPAPDLDTISESGAAWGSTTNKRALVKNGDGSHTVNPRYVRAGSGTTIHAVLQVKRISLGTVTIDDATTSPGAFFEDYGPFALDEGHVANAPGFMLVQVDTTWGEVFLHAIVKNGYTPTAFYVRVFNLHPTISFTGAMYLNVFSIGAGALPIPL